MTFSETSVHPINRSALKTAPIYMARGIRLLKLEAEGNVQAAAIAPHLKVAVIESFAVFDPQR